MTDYRDIARMLIQKSEALVLTGYLDQGKVPTWGWGHTGPEVHVGQTISPQLADHDLDVDIAKHDAILLAHADPATFAAFTDHEKAALLDFTFNTGGGPERGDKHEWDIWSVVRKGDAADIPAQFQRFIYVHVDGVAKTSAGLKNRRAAEVVMFNTGDVDAAGAAACAGGNRVCSAAIRELPTPPVPVANKAFSRTSLGLKIGQLLSGTSLTGVAASVFTDDNQSRLQGVHDTVSAHANELGHYGPALVSVIGAGVVLIAGAQFLIHLEQQAKAKL